MKKAENGQVAASAWVALKKKKLEGVKTNSGKKRDMGKRRTNESEKTTRKIKGKREQRTCPRFFGALSEEVLPESEETRKKVTILAKRTEIGKDGKDH